MKALQLLIKYWELALVLSVSVAFAIYVVLDKPCPEVERLDIGVKIDSVVLHYERLKHRDSVDYYLLMRQAMRTKSRPLIIGKILEDVPDGKLKEAFDAEIGSMRAKIRGEGN